MVDHTTIMEPKQAIDISGEEAKEFQCCLAAKVTPSYISSSMPLDPFGPIYTSCILSISLDFCNFCNFFLTLGTRPKFKF